MVRFRVREDSNGGCVYAIEAGVRVGEIAWQFNGDPSRVELKALSVREDHRGNGFGKALLQKVVEHLRTMPHVQVAYAPEVFSASALRAWGQVFPTTTVRSGRRKRTLEGMARRLQGYGFEPDREPPFQPPSVESPLRPP